jgi:hypothetical protein
MLDIRSEVYPGCIPRPSQFEYSCSRGNLRAKRAGFAKPEKPIENQVLGGADGTRTYNLRL